jgi:hypothetical protein
LNLSAASCGESSIPKKQYRPVFARYRVQWLSDALKRTEELLHIAQCLMANALHSAQLLAQLQENGN